MDNQSKWKVGDCVCARLNGGDVVKGTIDCIEYDEFRERYVADLDNGHWCYLHQIIRKIN